MLPKPVIFICMFLFMYVFVYVYVLCIFLNISCRNHFEIKHIACFILLEKSDSIKCPGWDFFPSKLDIDLWIFDQFEKLKLFQIIFMNVVDMWPINTLHFHLHLHLHFIFIWYWWEVLLKLTHTTFHFCALETFFHPFNF